MRQYYVGDTLVTQTNSETGTNRKEMEKMLIIPTKALQLLLTKIPQNFAAFAIGAHILGIENAKAGTPTTRVAAGLMGIATNATIEFITFCLLSIKYNHRLLAKISLPVSTITNTVADTLAAAIAIALCINNPDEKNNLMLAALIGAAITNVVLVPLVQGLVPKGIARICTTNSTNNEPVNNQGLFPAVSNSEPHTIVEMSSTREPAQLAIGHS